MAATSFPGNCTVPNSVSGFHLRRSGSELVLAAEVRPEGPLPHLLLQRLKVRRHRQDREIRAAENKTLKMIQFEPEISLNKIGGLNNTLPYVNVLKRATLNF